MSVTYKATPRRVNGRGHGNEGRTSMRSNPNGFAVRFLGKLNQHGPVHPYSPELGRCIEFTGYRDRQGYGQVWRSPKLEYAHRVSYELFVGEIPARDDYHGTVVMHTCDNPACCNPAHLRVGSQADNLADADRKMRKGGFAGENAKKTHCKRGHPFAGENLYVYPDGRRGCRECIRAGGRRRAKP